MGHTTERWFMSDNHVIVKLEELDNSCFIVMPFHSLFEAEYERVIRPAVLDAGLDCVRGDEIFTRQSIVHDIWKSIRKARVVIAELSGRNPNVMYETGLAHAIGKPIIFVTRAEQDVPFDLRTLRYIYYDPNNPFWGEDLRTQLTKVLRQVIENPMSSEHLDGIEIQTVLPNVPKLPKERQETPIQVNFSGVWNTVWESIKTRREHKATLVIPPNHGSHFNASMTVTYERKGKVTIVQETLSGTFTSEVLSLSGVNYTYIEQGNSVSYSLDSFELKFTDDFQSIQGKAILKNGSRKIKFMRVTEQSH